jgi:CheY-like chemotaxis protein
MIERRMGLKFGREIFVKRGVKILVVDDEAIVRRAIKMLLEHDGHKVWPVDSGEAALAELAQRSFDLVITDFSMPGMKGDQLVARIRQLMPTQPIILATAFVEDYKIFGQAIGPVDALLFKPFSLEELREAIERVLAPEQPAQTNSLVSISKPSPTQEFIPLPRHRLPNAE